ncbi:T9SS type A sorting domain-containing protein [Altibacter sp.]|uniref:VPS10 domain-containing protein n=1 Tax=Altibacter sp. TaxID=2024823 RepID=UPI0025835CE3|nr:T9SS type A sorting domain-containing protein [Altibacter sp.]MCW9037616.1 T9SS type A sorting domain-containing protein [Altibacter sp.]
MKKIISLVSVALLIFSVFIFSEKEPRATKATLQNFKEYPHEWMYNQRAYPNNIINKGAMENALAQSRAILSSRPESNGSDWTLVGPLNTGGRITDVAIDPTNDDVLYVGAATGGVFKTTNGGTSWTPIFDQIGKPSIGDIAIAPSNAQRLYVGTGEANGSATDGAYFGDGVYRSDDGGNNWMNVGLNDSDHIARIIVDPTDPDRVFAAATGRLYGYNNERGIYRSTNAGANWEQVLFVTDSTAAIDVVMNPQNTNILFAAMWERTRKPWQRDYGGVTSAIHRSTDGGNTWTQLGALNGLPAPNGQTGRIGLAISQSNPATVYARYTTNEITNTFNGLYRSNDNGTTWSLVTLSELAGIDANFGWYFGNIRVSPTDPDEVFVLGQGIARTTTGGASWETINGMHVDHHALEYSSTNPNFLLAGNDGGVYTSQNGGTSWTKFTNLPITQFYNIEVDNLEPDGVYGGTQDNNTIRTLTAGTNDWNSIWGGDGFHVNVDPVDNNFIYVEAQYGNLGRSTNGGASFSSATAGINGGDRNNWNTPVVLSPFNTEKVYYGTNRLYISDRAVLWSPISPDLTNGQHPSGSLSYGTLTAIAPSYNNLDVIYTGSDDGNVHVTTNGGTSWTNVSGGLPDRYVTSIAISPSDDATAYITFSGFSLLDYTPHVFKTIDGGQNWTDISGNLPSIPVNDIVLTQDEQLLFVATDTNVWYSSNEGTSWNILGNDLPITVIRDLKIHEPTNMLYAGTFGRSIHQYDLSNIVLNVSDYISSEESITLYPNPSRGSFQISHTLNTQGTITLYDLFGKKVRVLFEGTFSSEAPLSFSTEGISEGIYFVNITGNGRTVTKKLLVK